MAEPRFHVGVLSVGETDWEIANDKTLGVIFRTQGDDEWYTLRLLKPLLAPSIVREFLDQAATLAPVDTSRQTGRGWSRGWLNPINV